MNNDLVIAAIDVGKYENLGCAWSLQKEITCPEEFVKSIIEEATRNKCIIGFEAPLFIPTGNIKELSKARKNIDVIDGTSRPWSISTSFHCVIPLLDIFFHEISSHIITVFTDFDQFIQLDGNALLITEAFVSGGGTGLSKCCRKQCAENYRKKTSNVHNDDAEMIVDILARIEKTTFKPNELNTSQKFLNIPRIIGENNGVKVIGDTGLIVLSPKPCFFPTENQQKIIRINCGEQ